MYQGPRKVAPGRSSSAARARIFLLATYAMMGIAFSTWYSRLPSVQVELGISSAAIGALLLAGALGSLCMVVVAGPLVSSFGGRAMFYLALGLLVIAFGLLTVGVRMGSPSMVAAAVLFNGSSHSLTNVPANMEAAAVERRMGRSIMSQFHAAYALGALSGSLIGAAFSAVGVAAWAHFLIIGLSTAVLRFLCVPHIILESDTVAVARRAERTGVTERPGEDARARRSRWRARRELSAWLEPRTLMLGLGVFCFSLSGGSANNWMSLGVEQGLGTSEATAALVYSIFQACVAAMRLFGNRVIDRVGRVPTLHLSAIASLCGLLAFCLSSSIIAVSVGAAAWGIGSALSYPIGVSAAADDPLRSSGRVSVVSAFASVSAIVAPPLLGAAAEALGIRHALLFVAAALVLAILVVRAASPRSIDEQR